MSKKLLIAKNIRGIYGYLTSRRKKQLFGLVFLMVFATFTEMIGIGAVFPFLTIIVDPSLIYKIPLVTNLLEFLGFKDTNEFVLPLTIFFIFIILINGITRLLLLYLSTRVSFMVGADIALNMFTKSLYQSYEYHMNTNSSEIINAISHKTRVISSAVILPMLNVLSSLFIFTGIFIVLLIIKPLIAILTVSLLVIIYLLIVILTRIKLIDWGITSARETTSIIKTLQEGLSSIRDILIDGSQKKFIEAFHNSDYKTRLVESNIVFIAASPRFSIEAVGISLIALIGYFLSLSNTGIVSIIPLLGAQILAVQRILPLLQQSFYGWASIQASLATLDDLLTFLNLSISKNNNVRVGNFKFKDKIELKNVSFSYIDRNVKVIDNINLLIRKNSKIGIIGPSGSGKSTLVDIILGLLKPTSGTIEVDGKVLSKEEFFNWQSCISHVPQNIYLADMNIAENIAFSSEKQDIDFERLKKVIIMSQLEKLVESWPEKYEKLLGESGAKLSGGQKQRVGIARALYKKPQLIIFDEATSSLDTDTEESIINTIDSISQEITTITISHRLLTLKNCDEIIEIKNRSLKKIK